MEPICIPHAPNAQTDHRPVCLARELKDQCQLQDAHHRQPVVLCERLQGCESRPDHSSKKIRPRTPKIARPFPHFAVHCLSPGYRRLCHGTTMQLRPLVRTARRANRIKLAQASVNVRGCVIASMAFFVSFYDSFKHPGWSATPKLLISAAILKIHGGSLVRILALVGQLARLPAYLTAAGPTPPGRV